MAKDKKSKKQPEIPKPEPKQAAVQYKPFRAWTSFDACWAQCVKNSNPTAKESAKAHLQSLGVWDDQNKWIDALIHFGLKIEE
jgi:hypothetical protein